MVLAVGGGIWLARNNSKTSTIQDTKPQTQNIQLVEPVANPTPETVVQTNGKTVEVTIEGSNFKFTPNVIDAMRGDTIKLIFKSGGGIHDLMIDAFDVQTSQLGDGEEEEVEFVVDKMGTFEFYCSVANHRSMGMTGKLRVGGQ